MSISSKLREFLQSYHIAPTQAVMSAFSHRQAASPEGNVVLTNAGYTFNSEKVLYENRNEMIIVVLFTNQGETFVWVNGVYCKVLKNLDKLKIWTGGRENEFLQKLSAITHNAAEVDPVTQNPMGQRSDTYEPSPPMDQGEILIAQAKKKMGKRGTLPADDIIDLYQKAKQLKSNKLMTFLKTIKPLGENFIKSSVLEEVIREIVKGIVRETAGERSTGRIADLLAVQLWGKDFRRTQQKTSPYGMVFQYSNGYGRQTISKFLWLRDGEWKSMDSTAKPKQWVALGIPDPTDENPSEMLTPLGGMEEGKKTSSMYSKLALLAQKKLEAMLGKDKIEKLAKQYETEGDEPGEAYAKALSVLAATNGKMPWTYTGTDEPKMPGPKIEPDTMEEMTGTGAVAPIATPFAFKKKKFEEEKQIDEMTTTGAVTGYNIPSAFSRKGGSKKGIEGSAALGYTLTPAGEKDMQRSADKLLEGKTPKNGTAICKKCGKALHYAGQIECHKCGKVQK